MGRLFFFIHIPKTAGTSITYFFKENGFTVRWFSYFDRFGQEPSPQHRHREKIIEFLHKDSIKYDYSFTIVRDPLDRLISEYFGQLRESDELSRMFTSKDFTYWVESVLKFHEKNPVYFDNHLRPQVEFLLDDTRFFRYENNFEDFFSFLKQVDKECNFGIDFKKIGHYKKGLNKVSMDISQEIRNKVFQFYAKDYVRLYPFACESIC